MQKIKYKKPLSHWRAVIAREAVDVKSYSHNIIGIALGAIAKGWGREEANKAIVDFGLDEMGWSVKEEAREG